LFEESCRSEKVLPGAIGAPVTKACDSSKNTRGEPSAGFWSSLLL
jgi:hypothetical protein